MITYIIETKEGEFYCGKTNDLDRRMEQHKKEKIPHWFGFKNRKEFVIAYTFDGDVEKIIKRCGVKNIVKIIEILNIL